MTCEHCNKEVNNLTWVEGTMDYRRRETVLALCPDCYKLFLERKQEHEDLEVQPEV